MKGKMVKKIAITGGKGGVGKSTFSLLLVNKLRAEKNKVLLVDADVECPNDYLLLGEKLETPKRKVFAQFPQLIKEKCRKCGLCVRNCSSHAIFQSQEGYPVFLNELCNGCGLCWRLCPYKAIKIKKKVIGKIFENKIEDGFYLLTGQSKAMVEETGPIVSHLLKQAEKRVKQLNYDYLLVDTAPGMHCSVIRALIGVDFAYAVTEPTPLGGHDLRLILRLLKKLKIPAKVVLNQADLGKRKVIDKIIKEFGVKIEYEVPYSQKLAEYYSKGKMKGLNFL